MYGGTPRFIRIPERGRGLSPRVRGNPFDDGDYLPPIGSIPACTGEPIRPDGQGVAGRVYPRVYGGTEERDRW